MKNIKYKGNRHLKVYIYNGADLMHYNLGVCKYTIQSQVNSCENLMLFG